MVTFDMNKTLLEALRAGTPADELAKAFTQQINNAMETYNAEQEAKRNENVKLDPQVVAEIASRLISGEATAEDASAVLTAVTARRWNKNPKALRLMLDPSVINLLVYVVAEVLDQLEGSFDMLGTNWDEMTEEILPELLSHIDGELKTHATRPAKDKAPVKAPSFDEVFGRLSKSPRAEFKGTLSPEDADKILKTFIQGF